MSVKVELDNKNECFLLKKHRLDYISPPLALKGHSQDFALTSKEWNFVTLFSFVG